MSHIKWIQSQPRHIREPKFRVSPGWFGAIRQNRIGKIIKIKNEINKN